MTNHDTNRRLAAERCVRILREAGYTDKGGLGEYEWRMVEKLAGLSTKKPHPEVRELALWLLEQTNTPAAERHAAELAEHAERITEDPFYRCED